MIYEYDKTIPFNLEIENYTNYTLLKFDTVYEPDIPESKKIYVYKYNSENPLGRLIFLHGIGNGHIPYLMWFAEKFSKMGLETYFLIHPYHKERAKPNWKGGEPFYHHSPAHCVVRFHQAVKDVRRTIDLIEEIENKLPIGIMGFSFGGMIATISMALDKRIKAGVLSFTGGDWRWINWYSPYLEPVREGYKKYSNEWGCKDETKCVKLREESFNKLNELKNINEIFSLKPGCFHYDPISYAKFVDQPVLFFKGMFDKIMPKNASNNLYNKLQHARKVTIPSGHKSSYFFRRVIARKSLHFFKNTLNKKL
jgi:predicted esterase